jgi:predicted enzyme related to lactoylglutathione lyase
MNDPTPHGSSAPAYGRFVWHDLMTTDLESAKSFYTQLLGWDIRDVPMGPDGATYSMVFASRAEDAPGVGGFETIPSGGSGADESQADGPPPHWMGYVEVEDVDSTERRVTDAGGSVLVPPQDIPTVGRFCVIRDPEGGCLAPFQSAGERQPDPEPGSTADGQFVWNELLTHDTKRCAAFYPEVIGWALASEDMPAPDGSTMTYHMWMRSAGEEPAPYFDSGMMPMPPGAEAPTHWLHYVQVADVDATVEKAKALGGAVHCPPTDVPSVGRFAVLGDLQGASFAVFKGVPKPE